MQSFGIGWAVSDEVANKRFDPYLTAIHVLLELYESGRINGKVALGKLDTLQNVGRYSIQILEDARKRIKE